MVAWWIWFVLGMTVPAIEIINRTRFWPLIFGQTCTVLSLLTWLRVTDDYVSQGIGLAVVGAVFTFVVRPIYQRIGKRPVIAHTVDLRGSTLAVDGDIEPGALGTATMQERPFEVRNVGDAVLRDGDSCVVSNVAGFVLEVKASVD